jgi:predicted phage baseplate assembly protein
MNTIQAPLVRENVRSEEEICALVAARLEARGFAPRGTDPLNDALAAIFARYCAILVERLNRAPESHHQAFIDMLGAAPVPAAPARAPLTFKAVSSAQNFAAVVEKSTQVSASGRDGAGPVMFETVEDLPLARAELVRAVAADMRRFIHADVGSMISADSAACSSDPVSSGSVSSLAVPLERALHIGNEAIFGVPGISRLRLGVELDRPGYLPPGVRIQWGIRGEKGFFVLEPEVDTTRGLACSGEIVFSPPEKWPSWIAAAKSLPWLTCRLHQDNQDSLDAASGIVPDSSSAGGCPMIAIKRIEATGCFIAENVKMEGAFHGGTPLDTSMDFFPLGERPRFGEVFYVRSESFARAEARVALDVRLTNPAGAPDSPIPTVSRAGNPRLRWEGHTARGWVQLECDDGTLSLTQDGKIELLIPDDVVPVVVNAVKGGWVRARLAGGHYAGDQQVAVPGWPSVNPPSIAAMSLSSFSECGPLPPDHLVIESDLEYREVDPLQAQSFNPFPMPAKDGLLLYLALAAHNAAEVAGRTVSIYAAPGADDFRASLRDYAGIAVLPRWQVRGASGWIDCAGKDMTQGFSIPGIIELRFPADVSPWSGSVLDPSQRFFWLRLVWNGPVRPGFSRPLCLPHPGLPRRLLLNTVLATQTMRLENEILGSSNGRSSQVFHALHHPIIGKSMLEVREAREAHIAAVEPRATRPRQELHNGAGSAGALAPGNSETWIAWTEVEDFSTSSSSSRHYVLDRLAGSIRFGDGRKGCIPPPGANNIRLREYHTGGGRCGNVPPGAITQLHTTIPYVEAVTNSEAAAGGQDQEDKDALRRRAAARIRHRDRAICPDDYADLARMASPMVANARCVSGEDLPSDPVKRRAESGVISVIVVPNSTEPRPQPSYALLRTVKAFLDERRPLGVDMAVLGPEYVGIAVIAEIAWLADRSPSVAAAECKKRLDRFLHPVTGGLDGQGWQFGQRPHASDIYPLLAAIDGLDHIRSLELRSEEDRPGLLATGTFLVCAGKHEVTLC